MPLTTYEQRRHNERLDREPLRRLQLEKLNGLLATIVQHNRFYAEKLADYELPLPTLDDLSELPFTFKSELEAAVRPGEFSGNLTYPLEHYVRYHQTSGTRGRPLVVVDTAEDWQWWINCWQYVLDAAEIGPEDRVLLAFSFGPYIGFWSAHDALTARGVMVIPSGGMSTLHRLELIRHTRATALLCTPSYALHLAETAIANNIDTTATEIWRIIVAGEPGGSMPAMRRKIETAWNARLIDHSGSSEVGPWGYSDRLGRGLHILETDFIAEFLALDTGRPANDGEPAELVLTSLGRRGSPVIRYRTGDVVRPRWNVPGDRRFVLLEGGVLGRVDDMLIVRGVNVFPSSIEQILRSFPEIVEYRVIARKDGAMDALQIEVEDRLQEPQRIAKEVHLRLGLKVDVKDVPLGSLPRFEGKGKRFVDQRR